MARVTAQGVRTPHLLLIDRTSSRIYMEMIEHALTLKQFIEGLGSGA